MASVTTDRRRGVNASAAIKVACVCATTANITLSGEQTIDGIATDETRVFVKDQTDTTENGIYLTGDGAWTREPDFDGQYDVNEGTLIPVSRGTANSDTYWRVTNTGDITIGTTNLTFSATTVLSSAILNDGSVTMIANFVPNAHDTYDLGITGTRWRNLFLEGDADIDGTLNVEGALTLQATPTLNLGLVLDETADHSASPTAGKGEIWVRNDSPNVVVFTDDGGTDHVLNLDYQTGTYAATLTPATSGSITLDSAADTLAYTKIGRVVHVYGQLNVSSISSPVGGVALNLPYNIASLAELADEGGTPYAVYGLQNGALPSNALPVSRQGSASTYILEMRDMATTTVYTLSTYIHANTVVYLDFSYPTDA